ncbi:hypothetical protein [Amycolatopsis vastitatis]|uniref:Uncharacterized protein n=1 Tax=Amycolatopsis vastitatis TaxID=1905142 RepID=A0A229TKZ5_9PSEU|nr:hypothetical protein [Amycolatopsis vastitatis]OXM71604.1 hypothetical protein CF165_00650 [Amycolatopsis vastitatis]
MEYVMTPEPAVNDPADAGPLCDESEFSALIEEMVAQEAPQLFAVVQEYGERVDARIAAWGMAFPDHTEVISTDHTRRISLSTPSRALRLFSFGDRIRARLTWVSAVKAP